MKIRHLILLYTIILTSIACTKKQTLPQSPTPISSNLNLPFQPNIIWLVAEDLSPVIPSFGDSTIQTPNLSRLAKEGVCYDNVYSPSPVCAPSRAALATGMYPTHIAAGHMRTGPWHATNMPQAAIDKYNKRLDGFNVYEALPPLGVRMFSEYLKEEGYYCTNNAKQDYQFRCSVTAWDETSRKAHWKNRKPGQPFFAIFNYGVTHESRIWLKKKDSLWIDPNANVPVPPYLPDTKIGQQDVRRMYSNVKEMDYQVGQMLAELEAAGQLDSTIIIWYTDHGGPLPRQKRLLYDSGLRVPMIIRFPNKQFAGQRDNRMISFIDFAPTVLSLAGIQPPDDIDGKAFLGKFCRKEEPQHIFAAADRFDEMQDCNRAARDKQFKYIKYFEPEKPMFLRNLYREQQAIMRELYRLRDTKQLSPAQALWFRPNKPAEELFDTKNDPFELNNLADDPNYKEKLIELRTACKNWYSSFEDTGLMPETELSKKLRPDNKELYVEKPFAKIQNNKVHLSCNTKGATIGYKINQAKTSKVDGWQLYTKPFNIQKGDTLNVVADRIGYRYSEMQQIIID